MDLSWPPVSYGASQELLSKRRKEQNIIAIRIPKHCLKSWKCMRSEGKSQPIAYESPFFGLRLLTRDSSEQEEAIKEFY